MRATEMDPHVSYLAFEGEMPRAAERIVKYQMAAGNPL